MLLITTHGDVDFQHLRWNLVSTRFWTLKLLELFVKWYCSCIKMLFFIKCFLLVLLSIDNCWYVMKMAKWWWFLTLRFLCISFLCVSWHSTKREYFSQLFPTHWCLSLGLIHYFFIEWDVIYYCDYFGAEIDCSRFDQCDCFKLIPVSFVCVHIVSDLIRKVEISRAEAYFYTMKT